MILTHLQIKALAEKVYNRLLIIMEQELVSLSSFFYSLFDL